MYFYLNFKNWSFYFVFISCYSHDSHYEKENFAYEKHNITFEDIKSFEIYLESYRGLCYNEDNKKDYYFSLFTATSYEEMRKITGRDKETVVVVDEIEKLNQDKYFGGLYDANIVQKKLENTARHEGYNEGIIQGIERDKKK